VRISTIAIVIPLKVWFSGARQVYVGVRRERWPESETAEKTLMNGFDGAFILATSPLHGWSIDRHLAAAAIFCEIFSRHHFPVRCVTFYTRVAEFISYTRWNNCFAAPMRLFLRRYNFRWVLSISEDCLLIIIVLLLFADLHYYTLCRRRLKL